MVLALLVGWLNFSHNAHYWPYRVPATIPATGSGSTGGVVVDPIQGKDILFAGTLLAVGVLYLLGRRQPKPKQSDRALQDDRDHWMRTANEREGRLNECKADVAKLESEIAALHKPPTREKAGAMADGALAFAGFTGWKSPWTFGAPLGTHSLSVVYVRNNQLASAKGIHNVRARIDYIHNGEPRFSVPMASWWEERDGQPTYTPQSVDLEPNQQQCFSVFMQGNMKFPQSAFDGDVCRDLVLGRWTARITVTADNCNPIKGEMQFTVYRPTGGARLAIGCQPPLGLTLLPIEGDWSD